MRSARALTVAMGCVFAGLTFCAEPAWSAAPFSAGSNVSAMRLDLGEGESMEFVWIEPLKAWVGKYEVTNAQYRRFDPAHSCAIRWGYNTEEAYRGYPLNEPRQPVVSVSQVAALAFAEWLCAHAAGQLPQGMTVRLPTVAEWRTFAECGDGRRFTWGNTWPPAYGNYSGEGDSPLPVFINGYNDGHPVTCNVEDSGENPWGLFGVGGNVWEWTSETRGREATVCGGSWSCKSAEYLECRYTTMFVKTWEYSAIGFRLLIAAAPQRP